MPLGEFTLQPTTYASDGIVAAYRPIIIRVNATSTGGDPVPPVVYCDIYFDGVFYKTISKSQYFSLGAGFSEWEFDIQDAAQEYLAIFLAPNGGQSIVIAPTLTTQAFCRFRSSGFDTDGFILPEGTPPIQATGDTGASAGDGTQSDTFTIVNSTLQHEDNQDLLIHLSAYENRTWDASTVPLTHRPDRYKLCVLDSDYFPILSNKVPTKLKIHVVPKGQTEFQDPVDGETVCTPVSFSIPTMPNAQVGVAYSFTLPLLGSAPFAIDSSTLPDWLTPSIDGSNLNITGTPEGGDVGTHIQISVTITNCSGGQSKPFTNFIDVATCVAVSFSDFDFPNAIAGTPYSFTVPLLGTAPFIISIVTTKPTWLKPVIVGSNLVFSGTPSTGDIGTSDVQLTVANCGATDLDNVDTTITVTPPNNYTLSSAYNMSIDSVTGTGIPALGSTGVNNNLSGHHTAMSGDYDVTVSGPIVLPTIHIDVLINGSLLQTIYITSAGTYTFTIAASEAQNVIIAINS